MHGDELGMTLEVFRNSKEGILFLAHITKHAPRSISASMQLLVT